MLVKQFGDGKKFQNVISETFVYPACWGSGGWGATSQASPRLNGCPYINSVKKVHEDASTMKSPS